MISLEDELLSITLKKQKVTEPATQLSKKKRIVRSVKKKLFYYRKDDGSLAISSPTDTNWYKLYLQSKPSNDRLAGVLDVASKCHTFVLFLFSMN